MKDKPKNGRKLLSFLLSLALVLIPGMSLVVYADNNETLLTTIGPKSKTDYRISSFVIFYQRPKKGCNFQNI